MKNRLLFLPLCLALALCLLLTLCLGAAQAAPGDVTALLPDRRDQRPAEWQDFFAESAAYLDGAFYMLGGGKVARWQQDTQEITLLCTLPFSESRYFYYGGATPEEKAQYDQAVLYLTAGDGKLWGINNYSGRVGEVTAQGIQWNQTTLDMTDTFYDLDGSDRTYRSLTNFFVWDGALYCLRDDYSQENWTDGRIIMRWDLATGALTQLRPDSAQMLCLYKPGQLLTLGYRYDEKTESLVYRLAAMDIATGQETPLDIALPPSINYGAGGLAYDAATDTIYLAYNKQVWRAVQGAPFVVAAYLTTAYIGAETPAWILPGGLYAASADGLFIRNTDPQYLPTKALSIAGGYEDMTFRTFSLDNPDLPVVFAMTDTYVTAEAVAQDIASGGQTDIYVLPMNMGLRSLIEKGYTADLSASPTLVADIASMYPQVIQALCDAQGRPMAYPISLGLQPWTVDQSLWDKFNMGPLPTTFDELFDYMLRWQETYAEDNSEVSFLNASYVGDDLMNIVLQSYILQYEEPGKPIDFTSPMLRSVLDKVAQLRIESPDYEHMTDQDWEELYNTRAQITPIFSLFSMGGLFYDPSATQYISSDPAARPMAMYQSIPPLVFQAGETPRIRTTMQVMIANPASANLAFALQYIEYAAQKGMDNYTRYALHPDMNDPLELPEFERTVKDMRTWRDELAANIASASPEDQRYMQDSLDYVDRWLAEQDKNKWEISPAGIAGYRAMAQYMYPAENSFFFWERDGGPMSTLNELFQRYSGGQMPMDAFLQELTNKTRIMILEGI
ncbi:MAG: hypothetical protein LBU67_01600 [Oscillospiraceae bacterium]|jgi:hypothetical protein|nr:hypothetical protein [Oscillospiraceae bacterium]